MTAIPSTRDLLDLTGETVLITGASGNIGQAIARRLAEAGASVVLHYHRDQSAAAALLDELGQGRMFAADLGRLESLEELLESAEATMLVNNAAQQSVQNFRDISPQEWRRMMAVNLDAAFLLMQGMARRWTAAGIRGSMVNIGSIEGLDPAAGHGHYATSKAGLTMLSRAACLELGEAGIRVNTVSPGLISREGLEADWPEGVQRWQERAPLKCIGTPNDVADAVLFLLSPAARWISGANLVVDGGMSTQGRW